MDAAFPAAALRDAGYGAVWQGQKSWNGVAILARGADPVLTRTGLPGDQTDTQSRYIEAAVQGVLIGCLYLPNGNPQPGPKFTYKLAWFERLIAHAATLYSAGLPVALVGDYNVVPTDADIYPSKSWIKNALVQPQSRLRSSGCSTRAGPMLSARAIRPGPCIRFGIPCGIGGRATPACGSTIFWSARPWQRG